MGATTLEKIGGNLKRKYQSAKKSVKGFMQDLGEEKYTGTGRMSGDYTKDSYLKHVSDKKGE